jgi:hypothetical protein
LNLRRLSYEHSRHSSTGLGTEPDSAARPGTRTASGPLARSTIVDFVIAQVRQRRFQIPETGIEILGTARMAQKQ